MKYMGSKARIAKHLLPFVEARLTKNYVEPFVGGANMIACIDAKYSRYANDNNQYLIAMWKAIVSGWEPPKSVSKELYIRCRNLLEPDYLVGWVGIACSYSGKWFGGYAGKTATKVGTVRDYQQEAYDNVQKQLKSLVGVRWCSKNYYELQIPERSTIYCDPPYAGTTGYKSRFDSERFWDWSRDQVKLGHEVLVSEYSAPEDFICLWEQPVKSSLSANGVSGGCVTSTERLFVHKTQI
jgi:DNA adenine methylase